MAAPEGPSGSQHHYQQSRPNNTIAPRDAQFQQSVATPPGIHLQQPFTGDPQSQQTFSGQPHAPSQQYNQRSTGQAAAQRHQRLNGQQGALFATDRQRQQQQQPGPSNIHKQYTQLPTRLGVQQQPHQFGKPNIQDPRLQGPRRQRSLPSGGQGQSLRPTGPPSHPQRQLAARPGPQQEKWRLHDRPVANQQQQRPLTSGPQHLQPSARPSSLQQYGDPRSSRLVKQHQSTDSMLQQPGIQGRQDQRQQSQQQQRQRLAPRISQQQHHRRREFAAPQQQQPPTSPRDVQQYASGTSGARQQLRWGPPERQMMQYSSASSDLTTPRGMPSGYQNREDAPISDDRFNHQRPAPLRSKSVPDGFHEYQSRNKSSDVVQQSEQQPSSPHPEALISDFSCGSVPRYLNLKDVIKTDLSLVIVAVNFNNQEVYLAKIWGEDLLPLTTGDGNLTAVEHRDVVTLLRSLIGEKRASEYNLDRMTLKMPKEQDDDYQSTTEDSRFGALISIAANNHISPIMFEVERRDAIGLRSSVESGADDAEQSSFRGSTRKRGLDGVDLGSPRKRRLIRQGQDHSETMEGKYSIGDL